MPASEVAEAAKSWIHVILAVLNWPFLLFAFLVCFVLAFRKKVVGLLERGDIQISWGEHRKIKLKELSDGLDKELDPLKDEVQQLHDEFEHLRRQIEETPIADAAKEALDEEALVNAEERMLKGLKSHKFRWRSIERLAAMAGVSESDALNILRSNSEVVLSIDKSKRQIARLRDR